MLRDQGSGIIVSFDRIKLCGAIVQTILDADRSGGNPNLYCGL